MGIKKNELPPRDSITISPMTAVLKAGNWQSSSLFKVQNNTDEILYQIWIKLTIDHPHIRIQDFTIESPNPTDEPQVDVGQITGKEDSAGKKAKYLVIRRLNPGEIWQFIITKNSPYVPSRHSILYATILSFDKEPAPASFQSGEV